MLIPSQIHNSPHKHALVADDSLIHQRLAIHLLAGRGYQVTVVNNGQEAVVAARDFRFDLILMDIEMPVLDGCDATRQIREQETKLGVHAPIIAVTSLDDRGRLLEVGMDAYIAKPLTSADLDEVLGELVAETACC